MNVEHRYLFIVFRIGTPVTVDMWDSVSFNGDIRKIVLSHRLHRINSIVDFKPCGEDQV